MIASLMSTVRQNTIANYAGQAWAALMSVAFVPVYISYIGIEAYGVIGFFIALQSLFTILDLGISATLNRELARRSDVASTPDDTRDLVRTLEWIYWPTGVLIGITVWAVSAPLAQHWLRPVSLSLEAAAEALLLLGLSAALQWPVSFYTGGLSGLQRQVLLNVVGAVVSTVRAVGAVCVLWLVAPTIEAFLWWQVGVSAAQSALYARITWQALPSGSRVPSFNLLQLKGIRGFAAGIAGTTILSFLLTQTDRVVLSKLLPLDEFGVYAFAASAAFALFKLVYPIVTAVYPRYSQLVAASNRAALIDFYHRTNQLMAAVVLPVAAVVAAFAKDILWLWTRDIELASAAAPILALLVSGTALNGLMNLPYALQLAYGWTALSFWVNVVSVCFVVPAVWFLGQEFGGVGAASVWLALNLGYLTVGIPLMYRRVISSEMSRWYLVDMLPPFAASVISVLLWRIAAPDLLSGVSGIALLLLAAITTAASAVTVSPFPRSIVWTWSTKWRTLRIVNG